MELQRTQRAADEEAVTRVITASLEVMTTTLDSLASHYGRPSMTLAEAIEDAANRLLDRAER